MNRSYHCKDEELPVILRLSLVSLKRDLADFAAYSPKFSESYLTGYASEIAKVEELLSPASETVEKKIITGRLHSGMRVLLNQVNHLGGYLEMAESSIHLSATDFGLTELRKGIKNSDPEKVRSSLNNVNKNVVKYKEALAAQGLTDAFQSKLMEVYTTLNADRQLQYQIFTNRKALVQCNVGTLNELYSQLKEILRTGKILYQDKDAVKMKEYTFAALQNQVRRISKKEAPAPVIPALPPEK